MRNFHSTSNVITAMLGHCYIYTCCLPTMPSPIFNQLIDNIMKKRTRRDDPTLLSTKDQEHWNYSSSILRLPEACLAHVISMASPLDTLRCSAVSTAFHAAAISDVTWERFSPAGYRTILARADHPVDFTSTKKELFLTLAQDHVILDQGTKVRSELLVNCWPGYLGIG